MAGVGTKGRAIEAGEEPGKKGRAQNSGLLSTKKGLRLFQREGTERWTV